MPWVPPKKSYWNIGMMEYWNNEGKNLNKRAKKDYLFHFLTHHSIIPVFHYSI